MNCAFVIVFDNCTCRPTNSSSNSRRLLKCRELFENAVPVITRHHDRVAHIVGLIVSKSHHGIDPHSFPRRYVGREQGDGQKHERNTGE
jgi:hypothetical protein